MCVCAYIQTLVRNNYVRHLWEQWREFSRHLIGTNKKKHLQTANNTHAKRWRLSLAYTYIYIYVCQCVCVACIQSRIKLSMWVSARAGWSVGWHNPINAEIQFYGSLQHMTKQSNRSVPRAECEVVDGCVLFYTPHESK